MSIFLTLFLFRKYKIALAAPPAPTNNTDFVFLIFKELKVLLKPITSVLSPKIVLFFL